MESRRQPPQQNSASASAMSCCIFMSNREAIFMLRHIETDNKFYEIF